MNSHSVELSVVCTLYRSSNYVQEFYERITAVIKRLGASYELVFVNDGSPDDSQVKVQQLLEVDPNIKIIELSRNHGHHRAMLTGLAHAEGKRVFLTDIDLEEPPECLAAFWQKMENAPDVDVVYGVQERKGGRGVSSVLSRIFYIVFNAISSVKISDSELVSRLMTSTFVKALVQYQERELFLPAMWADVGFNQEALPVEKDFNGDSSYTLARRLRLAVDAVTSFSSRPLLFIFYMGTFLSAGSALFIVYLVLRKLITNSPLLGWTSTLASIYLVGGLILFSLGVIGIYLSRVFAEVKGRPYPIIRRKLENKTGEDLSNE